MSLSPPFSPPSTPSVPFNFFPSGIDPQLEVITGKKKKKKDTLQPRILYSPPYLVLLLGEKTSCYQTLLLFLKKYLSPLVTVLFISRGLGASPHRQHVSLLKGGYMGMMG